MLPDLSLCRFQMQAGAPRLGFVSEGQLYDLTATGKPQYASMEAWLKSASGRAEAAIAAVLAAPSGTKAVCSAAMLEDAGSAPTLLSPLDAQEVWACGVTYEMSRAARMRESGSPTIYGLVYEADRPEIFFKSTPHRVAAPGKPVAVRADSKWNVPEPELTLVVTPGMDVVGYTVGNDMSSRDIEGENPLYLAQAKVYQWSCAVGPVVRLATDFDPKDLAIKCVIRRDGEVAFTGETHTRLIHRPLSNLIKYLGRCNSYPNGLFVLTGTAIVPPDTFSLGDGDVVDITIEGLGTLSNPVIQLQCE